MKPYLKKMEKDAFVLVNTGAVVRDYDFVETNETDSLIPQKPYGRQKLFLEELKDEYEAFYGGAAGGMKSSAILMAALEHIEVPHYAALILRRSYTDLSLPDAIMSRAKEWLINKPGVHWSDKEKTFYFDCPNGGRSSLTFGFLEAENDKFRYQGAAFQFVGFDELTQFTETQYSYLFSRLRRPAIPCNDCSVRMFKDEDGVWIHQNETECEGVQPNPRSLLEYCQVYEVPLRMRSASNPGGVGHEWVKERFIPEDYLKEHASEARIWNKEYEDDEGRIYETFFVPSRVQDNPFLDQEGYIEGLGRLDRITREQLLHGDWAISPTGDCYFNYDALSRFQSVAPTVGDLKYIENEFNEKLLAFFANPDGHLAIWKKPLHGHLYSIGCDTASGRDANRGEGKVSRDFSVVQIHDVESGEQVARLRCQMSEYYVGEYWAKLAKWYDNAFVVPAVTGGYGRAALNRAMDCGLKPEYVYQPEDESGLQGQKKSRQTIDLGFIESTTTRPSLYSNYGIAIITHAIEIYDAVTLNECFSFEINKDGKPEARSGTKDDCVTADALSIRGIRVFPQWIRLQNAVSSNVGVRKYGQQPQSEAERKLQLMEARRRNSNKR